MTPNPAPVPIVKGSPRSKLRLGLDVFVWYRGMPEPFPAQVVVCNPGKFSLKVNWNRSEGSPVIDNPMHASERRGALRESFWDFTADASPMSNEQFMALRDREERAKRTRADEAAAAERRAQEEAENKRKAKENAHLAEKAPEWVDAEDRKEQLRIRKRTRAIAANTPPPKTDAPDEDVAPKPATSELPDIEPPS